MVLWAFMLMLFIALSLFVPDVPVPWLHWVCDLIPSVIFLVERSSYPYVTCTAFSVVWSLIPFLAVFYFRWMHFTSYAINEFRKRKILYLFAYGVFLPALICAVFFLASSNRFTPAGRFVQHVGESRLYLGMYSFVVAVGTPMLIVGFIKWVTNIPRIYFKGQGD